MQILVPERRVIFASKRNSEKVFRGVISIGALSTFAVLGLIAAYLFSQGSEVFRTFGFDFITNSKWDAGSVEDGRAAQFGVAAMLMGSVIVAVMAMIFSLPFVMGTALYLEYYAHSKLRFILVSILDVMAAIPSIVYGLWGYLVLMPYASQWAASINKYFSWIPIFKVDRANFDASPFVASLVLCLMILPIATSVAREVYSRAPQDQISAAYALGASRWGAIRAVVLPFGLSGLVGECCLVLDEHLERRLRFS